MTKGKERMFGKFHKGFTIVEIMIVVFLVALIMTMALPNYLKARAETQKQSCIANLWQINEAVKQWVLENDVLEGVSLQGNEAEIYAYMKFGQPTCLSGGTYTLGIVGQEPQVTCSKELDLGHKLE